MGHYGRAADVWSLGISLLEAGFGRYPYGGGKVRTNIALFWRLPSMLNFCLGNRNYVREFTILFSGNGTAGCDCRGRSADSARAVVFRVQSFLQQMV